MATSNTLPTLKISFEAAAQAVANRSKKGYVALLLRDAEAQGLHVLTGETLIPSALGEKNKAVIRSALQGSDRGGPSRVYISVIAPGTEDTTALQAGLKALETVSIDYIAPPTDATEEELTLMAEWVKTQRALYRTVKLVQPLGETGSDNMGIIDLSETGLATAAGSVTAGEYCPRLAGILAGIPMGMSATYAALPELTAVTKRSIEEQTEAIGAGQLIFLHDGLQAKIARAVNSLTTIPENGKEDWTKIKIVEGMDLVTYYLRSTIENEYLGRYPNTYDNKQLLITAISDYLSYLERSGVLERGKSFAEIDYDAQVKWITEQGVDTTTMTEQQILEYQTGSFVFIRCGGRLLDAMEDFEVLFETV